MTIQSTLPKAASTKDATLHRKVVCYGELIVFIFLCIILPNIVTPFQAANRLDIDI